MTKNDKKQEGEGNPFEKQLVAFKCWLNNQGLSEGTIGQYLGVSHKFGRYLSDNGIALEDVHEGHVEAFLAKLKPRIGSLEASKGYHRTGIGRLLDYLQDVAICPTPIDCHIDGYATQLREHGYTERTITQYVGTCRLMGKYLRREGIVLACLSENHIEGFLEQLTLKRKRRRDITIIHRDYRRRLWLLLEYLRKIGECSSPQLSISLESANVTEYLAFLCKHRGLISASIENQRRILVRFLAHANKDGTTEQLRSLTIEHVDGFLIEAARYRKRTSMSDLCATLRGFFRFLHMKGVHSTNLGKQVTMPRIYQQEGFPRSVSWEDVQRTLEVVDRDTTVGLRDYAIMVFLAYYGLRACEIATLKPSNVDWRNNLLSFHRAKNGAQDVLPLLPIVGNALIDYIKIRPDCDHPELFIKVIAPSGPISSAGISWLARKYLLAAGIDGPCLGAHTLRHSHAVRLLHAGFSLKTIGDTLGHRNPQSTFIYAKAAIEDLRSVSLDVDEVQP